MEWKTRAFFGMYYSLCFTSLPISWIRRLFNLQVSSQWKCLAIYWFLHLVTPYNSGLYCFVMAQSSRQSLQQLPPFYRSLLQDWHRCASSWVVQHLVTLTEAAPEPLWEPNVDSGRSFFAPFGSDLCWISVFWGIYFGKILPFSVIEPKNRCLNY